MTDSTTAPDRRDDGSETETVAVTFRPEEWVDSPGEAHDWDRRLLIPARERDPITYEVPRADAVDDAGELVPDDSYEATMLRAHPAAPDWVIDWDGPYDVTVSEKGPSTDAPRES